MEPRTIVMLGKAGSGKGTQVELLQKKLTPHLTIHTGTLFRTLAAHDSLIGRKAKEELERGELLPSWLATLLWQKVILEHFKGTEYLIFDGLPRRLEEATELANLLTWLGRPEITTVLIDISDEEALKRLTSRAREDDTHDAINVRLRWFRQDVGPVIDYYKNKGQLTQIDGVGTVEEVAARVAGALNLS